MNGGNHSGVGDFTVIGNGRFGHKEDGIGACWHAGADALSEASYIVGEGLDPGGAVRATDEVLIFKRLTADWVNNDVGPFFLLE